MKRNELNWFISRLLGVSVLALLCSSQQEWAPVASMVFSTLAIGLLAAQTRLAATRS